MRHSHHTSVPWRKSIATLAALLTAVLLASTLASAQDVVTTEPDLVALGPVVDHMDGASLENALERAGLGDIWREATDLSDATRRLLVEYPGRSSESAVSALATVLTDLQRAAALQTVITGQARRSTALLGMLAQYEERLVRQIDREQTELATAVTLIQSVTIDMFSNAGGRSPSAISIDNSALLQTRRADELTATVLEALIHSRGRLTVDLAADRARMPELRSSRAALETSREGLARSARELPARLLELETSVAQLLPAAAVAFQSAEITDAAGLSLRALEAYFDAETWMTEFEPECGITWQTIGAIGLVESRHGTHRGNRLNPDGRTEFQIIGAVLDGTTEDGFGNTIAVVTDTDGGVYDGDPIHDRAIGPMQFIPETWRQWSVDADDDGRRDPSDLDDAAVATARLLCAGGSIRGTSAWDDAIYTYNQSRSYVDDIRTAYHDLDDAVTAATIETTAAAS